jgi:hypothetical protein
MSFARRIREAWALACRPLRASRAEDRILEWQLRLRLAKHFHQGISDEPPTSVGAATVISNQSGSTQSEREGR